MTDKLRAAAQAALEELIASESNAWNIINDLEAALAEPAIKESLTVAEPHDYEGYFDKDFILRKEKDGKRPWVGLTDEEILRLYKEHAKYQEEGMKLSGWGKFAADVQAKLREKNT